jgi:hypothetical protein
MLNRMSSDVQYMNCDDEDKLHDIIIDFIETFIDNSINGITIDQIIWTFQYDYVQFLTYEFTRY